MSGSRPQVGPGRVVSEAVQAAVLIPAQEGVDRIVIFGLEVVAQTTHYGVPQLTVRGLGDQLVVRAQRLRSWVARVTVQMSPSSISGVIARPPTRLSA